MASTFKKQFIANGLVAHVIKRKSGKNTFCYEIRYRSKGFEISAASNDLNKAKAKFLQKTVPREIEKYRTERATISFPKFFPKRCRNRKNECIIIRLYNIKLAFMQ